MSLCTKLSVIEQGNMVKVQTEQDTRLFDKTAGKAMLKYLLTACEAVVVKECLEANGFNKLVALIPENQLAESIERMGVPVKKKAKSKKKDILEKFDQAFAGAFEGATKLEDPTIAVVDRSKDHPQKVRADQLQEKLDYLHRQIAEGLLTHKQLGVDIAWVKELITHAQSSNVGYLELNGLKVTFNPKVPDYIEKKSQLTEEDLLMGKF